MRKPNTPAPRKFQKPTAIRNMTAHLCGNPLASRTAPCVSAVPPSRMNRQASTVSSTSGITSIAEKNAPSAMWTAGAPLK